MTDTSPTLTESQCIDVSINSFCNESGDSFEAQLHYTEGVCVSNGTEVFTNRSTDKYKLGKDYVKCVPIKETGTICYSAQVYHDGVVVGRTEPQQLILLPCNTSSLNLEHQVVINSTIGLISLGDKVVHNTRLFFQCMMGCDLSGQSQTRCVNGTFVNEPSSAAIPFAQCNCPGKRIDNYNIIVS